MSRLKMGSSLKQQLGLLLALEQYSVYISVYT